MKNYKNYLLGTSICIALFLMIPAANAAVGPQNDWYLGLSGDLTWLRHSDTGGGGNVDLGYRFTDWRLEAEAGYHSAGGKSGYGSTHYFTYMGNLYYDFNRLFSSDYDGWHIAPYIGGGLGDASVHYSNNNSLGSNFTTTFHHHTDVFAYEGMAGLNFASASMPRTDWYLGYRYLGTDKNNLHSNNLELGLRFHFN